LIGDKVSEMHVDMGYRGNDYDDAVTVHVDKRRRGKTPPTLWRWMKYLAVVEPSIGHLKSEHRLERNRLKGIEGNAVNAILSTAAMNFHKPLGPFLRTFLYRLLANWNALLTLQRPQARNTQLQYSRKLLFQDRLR
jgi:IS5 family transposase